MAYPTIYDTISADLFWRKAYMNNDKVYQMDFSKIYPLLVNKAKKKGRTEAEVDEIICWLTGYSRKI